jgi:PAS domain S-box-containing protein
MNDNDPKTRLEDLELEINDLASHELEESLQKELSFRRAIENSIPSGIAVVDDTGKQVYVNQSFCKMFGWDEDELLGKHPPYVYWSQPDIENINNALQQTLNNNVPKEGFDLVFRHKSGNLIPVNVIISPFVQQDNKTYWLANVIDITKRKKSEETLKKSQLLLMSSIESQKDTIIFSIDRDYHYLYFNKAHADSMKFAYNADVKPGINFLDCISKDDDRELLKENVDQALRGDSLSLIQAFGDINIDYYEVFFNPIVNEKDEIIGCASMARNISDRKKTEQSLKDNEVKFKEIIDQINDALIVFDEQGKIIIWNKGAEQVIGLKAEDTLNRSIVDVQYQLTPPSIRDKALIESGIESIITRQTPDVFNQIIESEIISLNSDNLRNIQSIVFPVKLIGYHLFCTIIRDTTELKRYEKELLRISAEKDKLYSIIAQYLYTPFNLFKNFSKLMAEELDSLPIREIQKMAVMMSKSANNLYNLLDNMLQWTKMNQGKIPFEPQKLNLKKISQDSVSILKPDSDSKNIKINHFVADEIDVFADVFMLKTILRNLVTHGMRFPHNDIQIDISADQTPSSVTVSVLDNGSGIAPDYITKLFDISQIHSTLGSAEEKGTTLGLLLCKEFVDKHGGKIWVESVRGKGTEFKFTLPKFTGHANGKSY